MFASDIAPGRTAAEASLSTKTSQTVARLLGLNSNNGLLRDDGAQHEPQDQGFPASSADHQPHIHVAPAPSRVPKSKLRDKEFSSLRPDDAADHSSTHAAASALTESMLLPQNVAAAFHSTDPRFDENRLDNHFLGPLLTLQVMFKSAPQRLL